MNNKGFMMAEVVVVSAIILIFMTSLYVSYNKIFTIYNQRVDYYDVTALYKLGYYREELALNNSYSDILTSSNSGPKILNDSMFNGNVLEKNDIVYLIYNNKQNITNGIVNTFNSFDINLTFKDYISFLSTSVTLESDYVMIMERCVTDDNCKYAYLEVYSG